MSWSDGGKENFQSLLELLGNAASGTYRTLKASLPTTEILSVPNNKDNHLVSIEKIKIEISTEIDWDFKLEQTNLHIILSPTIAKEWSQTIDDVKSHNELKFKEIYFWW